jgi:hypothetical protein
MGFSAQGGFLMGQSRSNTVAIGFVGLAVISVVPTACSATDFTKVGSAGVTSYLNDESLKTLLSDAMVAPPLAPGVFTDHPTRKSSERMELTSGLLGGAFKQARIKYQGVSCAQVAMAFPAGVEL